MLRDAAFAGWGCLIGKLLYGEPIKSSVGRVLSRRLHRAPFRARDRLWRSGGQS